MKDKILYIDDIQDNLALIENILGEKYDIYCCTDLQTANILLETNTIKVIISDQNMPEMTGTDYLISIKEIYPFITKIILTAYKDYDIIKHAFENAEIYKFINKPVDIESFRSTINHAVDLYNIKTEKHNLLENLKKANKELELAHNIVNNIQIGLHIYKLENLDDDRTFKMVFANPASEEIMGLKAEDLVGKYIDECLPELRAKEQTKIMMEVFRTQKPRNVESIEYSDHRVSKSYFSVRLFPLPENHVGVSFENINSLVLAEQNKLNAILETEEKERTFFARELHDSIGPYLSVLSMYMNDLLTHEVPVKCSETLKKSLEILETTIYTVKEISHALSPQALKQHGLAHAIKSFCKKIEHEKSPKFNLLLHTDERFEKRIEFTLFRVTTELINNTLKYGHASEIGIELKKTENKIELFYHDNGVGFDIATLKTNAKGMGLMNIQSRVEVIKGFCNIQSEEGKGMSANILIYI